MEVQNVAEAHNSSGSSKTGIANDNSRTILVAGTLDRCVDPNDKENRVMMISSNAKSHGK